MKDSEIDISIANFHLLSADRQELLSEKLHRKSNQDLKLLIDNEIKEINEQIERLKNDTETHKKIVTRLSVKINKSKALEDLTKEQIVLEKTLSKIEKLEATSRGADEERTETIRALAKAYVEFEKRQSSIYKTI